METPKTTAKDFFIYLGIVATLYFSLGSLLALLFNYINYLYPDVLTDTSYYYDPYTTAVRLSLAMLIIIFPVFLGLSYYLNNELRFNPAKKDIGIRKWLLLLTIFLGGAIVLGDLVTLVNTFLNGEVTARFGYKVLAVLIVIGITLYYYILDLRAVFIEKKTLGHLFGGLALALVLGTIISGFFIIGSPQTARLIRFDMQKVSDLQSIQSQVVNYWQTKSKLPTALSDMKDSLSYWTIPTDLQNNASYEYTVKGAYSFEICATFNKDSNNRKYPSPYGGKGGGIAYPDSNVSPMPINEIGDTWQYKIGRSCFTRTIDPEVYKPYPKSL